MKHKPVSYYHLQYHSIFQIEELYRQPLPEREYRTISKLGQRYISYVYHSDYI